MSHLTKVKVQVRDLEVLKKVCAELGLEFKKDQKTYKWFGTFVGDSPLPAGMKVEDLGQCDHAISVKGNKAAYEVGLRKQKDGSYQLAFDFWSGGCGLEKIVGKNCSTLMSAYSQAVAKKSLTKAGYIFSGTKKLSDGTTEMVFTK